MYVSEPKSRSAQRLYYRRAGLAIRWASLSFGRPALSLYEEALMECNEGI
jgi:hypothetical protein